MFHKVFPSFTSAHPQRGTVAVAMRLLLVVLVLSAIPAMGQDTQHGLVVVPLANVRQEPEPKAPILTQVLMGDEVLVLEKMEYRCRIRVPAQGGIEGWVHQEALILPRDGGKAFLSQERQRVVIAVPKTRALILDPLGNHNVSLYAGTRLPVVEESSTHYTVQFPDRTRAVIERGDVSPDRPWNPVADTATAEAIARIARQFRGARGFAGGMTVQGIDMGGLIHIAYRIQGIPAGRTASDLEQQGDRIDKKAIELGDILVFHGEGLGLSVGSGRFLRTDGRGPVSVLSIHDKRYSNSLRYGIRIIGTAPFLKKRPFEMTADEILITQGYAAALPLNERIAYWAEKFVGTPYDPDPLGLYVRSNRIVADEKVDCMYHTFRSVELALTATPREAIEKAIDKRFRTTGQLVDGMVRNYDERFDYGEDMVFSGKWGANATARLGKTEVVAGSRGRDSVEILPRAVMQTRAFQRKLADGDIIFWVKDPKRRVVDEIVAHLSIVRVKDGIPFLVHAAGSKDTSTRPGGGQVKEVPLSSYVKDTRFIGAFVTRFEP